MTKVNGLAMGESNCFSIVEIFWGWRQMVPVLANAIAISVPDFFNDSKISLFSSSSLRTEDGNSHKLKLGYICKFANIN